MVETDLKDALSALKQKGFKYTAKRETMLTCLLEADRYLSARDVYEYMQQHYEGISYDTIYRNLRDFAEVDLVEETELQGEKKFRFRCSLGKTAHHHHHHHFICRNCGMTKAIELCPMDFFKEQLPGCRIDGHRFEIYGLCEQCALLLE